MNYWDWVAAVWLTNLLNGSQPFPVFCFWPNYRCLIGVMKLFKRRNKLVWPNRNNSYCGESSMSHLEYQRVKIDSVEIRLDDFANIKGVKLERACSRNCKAVCFPPFEAKGLT